jgi:hypothetical protein
VEGPLDSPRDLRAVPQRIGPAADRPEAVDLVRYLVERAQVLADQRARNVRHDQKHGLGARLGLDERRQGVGRARTRRDHDDAGPARCPRVAVGHESRALLVPGEDVGDAVLTEERVVDGEVVNARDPEDVAHTFRLERGHHPLAPGPAGHGGHRATVA